MQVLLSWTLLVMLAVHNFASDVDNEGFFTANQDLLNLLHTEKVLIRNLNEYVHAEENRIEKLKTYISHGEEIYRQASEDLENYVGNPLNSYILIKKLTTDWRHIKDLVSSTSTATKLITTLHNSSHESQLNWPSENDLNGAALALARLQDTYQLDPADLARGQINGVTTGSVLSAHDCFELGRQTYNSGDAYHTILWMKQALLSWEEETDKSVDKVDILEYLAFTYYTQNNIRRALKYTEELLKLSPTHPRANGNKIYYESQINSNVDSSKRKGDDGFNDNLEDGTLVREEAIRSPDAYRGEEYESYKQMCRGEVELPVSIRSKLRCRYFHGFNSYYKLAPYKEEEVFLKPRMVLYYDVLNDAEIDVIKSLATPRFKRATVQNYKTGELETASYRISKTAWLKADEHPRIRDIYQRVADLTGLNMETSEELQVANYGIGGHYEPHFDFARREEKNAFQSLGTGNRLATWLFYVSDVEQGGATVFPILNVSLRPQKGAAVFWYNLYRNGEGNEMTRHAACPVLKGTKWVSNFWIHERGQEFTKPCLTDPFT